MSDAVEVDILPHPVEPGRHQAVIRDSGAQRGWSGEGGTASEAATEAMRKFLGDRRAREYVVT